MKERPILFTAPMVRAILDGSKTQTRRIDKYMSKYPPAMQPDLGLLAKSKHGESLLTATWEATNGKFTASFCPYGKVGDRLWAREAFCFPNGQDKIAWYRADSEWANDALVKWKPSIHMPRRTSRILLEITGVRVERLQDISRGDAMDEGCPFPNMAQGDDPRKWYADLWNSINGPSSWDANHWVWVIEFKRIQP